jgi:dipeptidyl aminopeptidase/acylaminoacyl peptidase
VTVAPPQAAEPAAESKAPEAAESGATLEQLLNVHRAVAPRALSSNAFLFLSDAPGTMQLFRGAVDSADADKRLEPVRRQLTNYPDRISGFRVSPDETRVVFLKDSGGDENDQIFLLPLEAAFANATTTDDKRGDAALALTNAPKVKHTLPVFREDGARVAFTSNARNGKDMDLYVEQVPSDAASAQAFGKKPVARLDGSHFVSDFKNGKVLVTESRSNVDQNLWIIDERTGSKTLLTKHTGDERYDGARFSKDGRVVFVLTDAGREFMALTAIDTRTLARTTLLEADHDLSSLAVQPPSRAKGAKAPSPDADRLVVTENVGGVESAAVLDLDAKRAIAHRADVALRGVFGGIDLGRPGEDPVAYIAFENAQSPTEVYRIELDTGAATRVTTSDHAGIDESALVAHELLTMKASDGQSIQTFWYAKPARAGEKRPVVVVVHGGPEAQSQPNFNPVVQYLVSHGYSVATPNVRGSLGYGKSFAHLDDKEKREDSVRDLHEMGEFLAKRPDVDPQKLAVYGGSYGGYMVLASMTLYPEQWAAGVNIVGIANFRTFLEQTAPYRRALREAEYGSLEKDGELLDRISPLHRVDKIRAPLMIIHGTRDPRVPIGEAQQIHAALEQRKLPVELMTFDDEGHGLSKRKNRLVAYPAVVRFLDRHVKRAKSGNAR